ncbi:MAG: glycosyl hydrolase family 28-related protein [Kiritimatiellae bacterium]|nr:glycosyl hydrolase family 28-related protein [Kiritimatiellia bacterium]
MKHQKGLRMDFPEFKDCLLFSCHLARTFGLAIAVGLAPLAKGADSLTNLVVVATVQERDQLTTVDGLSVLVKATGNFHRWYAAEKRWRILNTLGLVNVKDYGAVGDGKTDDTAAISSAMAAAYDTVVHLTIVFPTGTYRITRTLPTEVARCDLLGLGEATIDGPGPNQPVFRFDPINVPIWNGTISGLTFQNFRNVIRAWTNVVNSGWSSTIIFQNCQFRNGEYVIANCMTQNLYPIFSNIRTDNCNLFKGFNDGISLNNISGTTRTNAWTGGWCEGGGVEDGIPCPVGAVLTLHANHINLKPGGVDPGVEADQSWFKLNRMGWGAPS